MEKIPFDEQETDIVIDYIARKAYVYTCHPKQYLNLLRIVEQHPEDAEIIAMSSSAIEVAMPIKWIKIKPTIRRPDASDRMLLTKGESK